MLLLIFFFIFLASKLRIQRKNEKKKLIKQLKSDKYLFLFFSEFII